MNYVFVPGIFVEESMTSGDNPDIAHPTKKKLKATIHR